MHVLYDPLIWRDKIWFSRAFTSISRNFTRLSKRRWWWNCFCVWVCLRFPKKNINKNRKRCGFFLFKVFIFPNLPFFGTNFRNRTTFPSTRVRALFLLLNHQTFKRDFSCVIFASIPRLCLCVCDIGIISVHLGVFYSVKLVDLTCVFYSV